MCEGQSKDAPAQNKTQHVGKDLAPIQDRKHTNLQHRPKNMPKYALKADFLYPWYIFALFCLLGRFLFSKGPSFLQTQCVVCTSGHIWLWNVVDCLLTTL